MAIPAPDSSYSTLAQIRTKVRRLTRSLSTAQLSNNDLDNYINTFVLYDFPENLRVFSLCKTLTFYTQPYISTYENNTVNSDDPLYNFKNKYTNVYGPIYISGYESFFAQNVEQFYAAYPKTNYTLATGSTGDGVTTEFSGTLSSKPLLQNHVTFTSIDSNDAGIVLVDSPIISGVTGNPTKTGGLYIPGTTASLGTIDYVTGVYSFTFPSAPATGEKIEASVVPISVSKPSGIFYYDNKFEMRPVPDKSYRVDVQVAARPLDILSDPDDAPLLSQWWQYIAYGASKKVFEDRMDTDSIQAILPEFKKQEMLVLARTLIQDSTQRAATIYAGQIIPGVSDNGLF